MNQDHRAEATVLIRSLRVSPQVVFDTILREFKLEASTLTTDSPKSTHSPTLADVEQAVQAPQRRFKERAGTIQSTKGGTLTSNVINAPHQGLTGSR